MPEYRCRVGTPRGEILTRTVTAPSLEQARRELERQGYWIFEIRPRWRWATLAQWLLPTSRRKIPPRRFIVLNRELATLLRAGLPLPRCLELLEARQRDPFLRSIVAGVRERVRGGAALSEAFAEYTDAIPSMYVANLVAGERSGHLEHVLERFVRHQEFLETIRHRLRTALTYPAILLVFTAILVTVLFVFVVPRFVAFYATFEAEIPWITQVVLGVADFIRRVFLIVLMAVVVFGYAVVVLLQSIIRFRRWWHERLRRIWLVGPIMETYAVAQFAHTLATLLASGLPLVAAIDVAASAVWNEAIAHRLRQARQWVREGMSLHEALERAGIRHEMLLEMVQVGEQTGALDEMLEHAAQFYDDDVTTSVQRLMTLMEPAVLVIVAVVVLIVLLSVYYPIFSLSTVAR